MGLTEMGLVKSVDISSDGDVRIHLRLTSPFCHMIAFMQSAAKDEVGVLPGVRTVALTADQGLDWSPSMIAEPARRRRQDRLERFNSRSSDAPPGGDRSGAAPTEAVVASGRCPGGTSAEAADG